MKAFKKKQQSLSFLSMLLRLPRRLAFIYSQAPSLLRHPLNGAQQERVHLR